MASTLDSRPSATTFDVERLVSMAWKGGIRVPHFQRDFRWGAEDVRKLFDSIVKGYPVGSLLLWTRAAPAQRLALGSLSIDAPQTSEAMWVVDGQQRLTSIANALHPSNRSHPKFGLSYDLGRGEFVKPPQTENSLIIPLSVIFNLQQILRWFSDHPEIAEFLDQATNITQRIRQFEVPAYLVSHEDPRVLQDIFDRMNSYGKRLSRAEIFSALNAGAELHGGESRSFDSIAQAIDADLQFGMIDNDTVLAAILARRGTEVRRDIRTEFTKDDDEGRDQAYEAGEEALRRAVLFLQTEANVPHIALLAYRYLLVVLTRVFAFFPEPDARNLQLLRRWYWRAAVAGPERFRGGTPNAARVLLTQVVDHSLSESIQGLLKAVDGANVTQPDLERFATNESATKIVLCSWWALGPREVSSAKRYELADLATALADQQTGRNAVRYLVPRTSVEVGQRPWAANRAMMPYLEVDPREVNGYLATPPLELGEARWVEMLGSHSITPQMAELLAAGDVPAFLAARQGALERHLRAFLHRMTEQGFENTPPLSSLVLDEDDDLDPP
jgi:hypothetical protein